MNLLIVPISIWISVNFQIISIKEQLILHLIITPIKGLKSSNKDSKFLLEEAGFCKKEGEK